MIATYDRARWLAVALRSLQLAAEFASLQGISARILVVDDSSPSGDTRDVCRRLNVDYACTEGNDGRSDPSAARIVGLGLLDSEFFAFFDDDDVMLPRWLPLHIDALRQGADVCFSAYGFVDANLKAIRSQVPSPIHVGDLLANHNMVNDHSLVRTEVGRDVFDPELGKAMPFGAWLELAYRGAVFTRLTEPTYLYRRHDANMSTGAKSDETFDALRRELVSRYQDKFAARDGTVPGASLQLRARRLVPAGVKRCLRGEPLV